MKVNPPNDGANCSELPSEARAGGVTQEDVALLAGVTSMTVSRVLNRPELVAAATRARVMKAVEQTGYVPNLVAGALATNKSRLVALLLPTIATSIFTGMVRALMDTLAERGYQTLLGLTDYSQAREEELVSTLMGRRPDAIVLTGTAHSDITRTRLRAANVPIVEVWDITGDPLDMLVGFSHEAVGTAVADYLTGKGYRRFAVISLDDPRGMMRSVSLQAALTHAGMALQPMIILPAPASMQSGREGLIRLLAQEQDLPEVIVCSTDTLAQGILAEAASRGIHIPRDVAVMGFGDLPTAASAHPSISTVRIDGEAIGKVAAQAVLHRLTGSPKPAEDLRLIDLGFSIIERQSA